MEMSVRSYRRLTRYAAYAVGNFAFFIALVVSGYVSIFSYLVLVVMLPLYLALGLYVAEVAMNPDFSETDRRRWWIAFSCLPWSIALYWHRYVRGRLSH
jgi:hypothetical protein